ncbi:hypothetical protein [Tateyamaria sp. ANG-S1]|uniref:hypothetical protein n=1 Tax=Tateyamaria sp. ANG-S1 TaxID=1577905 RepID=UPI00187CA465|nr:hypothetical protein [Tateyamaria sp. ANG-S1]
MVFEFVIHRPLLFVERLLGRRNNSRALTQKKRTKRHHRSLRNAQAIRIGQRYQFPNPVKLHAIVEIWSTKRALRRFCMFLYRYKRPGTAHMGLTTNENIEVACAAKKAYVNHYYDGTSSRYEVFVETSYEKVAADCCLGFGISGGGVCCAG